MAVRTRVVGVVVVLLGVCLAGCGDTAAQNAKDENAAIEADVLKLSEGMSDEELLEISTDPEDDDEALPPHIVRNRLQQKKAKNENSANSKQKGKRSD